MNEYFGITGTCRYNRSFVNLYRCDDYSDWIDAHYMTHLVGEHRRKLFLIRALRVLAEEEKRIFEMTDEQIADELSLYGADRLRTI